MPSVASLLDTICSDASIDGTVGSEDRIKALECLQRTYEDVATTTYCIKRAIQVTIPGLIDVGLTSWTDYGGTDESALDPNLPSVLSLDGVSVVANGNTTSIPRKPYLQIVTNRSTTSTSHPQKYAYSAGTLHLDQCAAASVLVLYVTLSAPTVSEATVEAGVLGIPPGWHRRLLCTGAVGKLLLGYEGDLQRAALFQQDHLLSMQDWNRQRSREGGLSLNAYEIQDYTTPPPVMNR